MELHLSNQGFNVGVEEAKTGVFKSDTSKITLISEGDTQMGSGIFVLFLIQVGAGITPDRRMLVLTSSFSSFYLD
ncbi:MAG TPA: hypothetical protein VEP90_11245 [Methylomirabilota bacterium]|nr:hypothetical protein [Methylomirabilota bacterium]